MTELMHLGRSEKPVCVSTKGTLSSWLLERAEESMQTMQKHVREVQVQLPGPYFLFSSLSPLTGPLKANLQDAPLEVVCQMAVAVNLAISAGESFPTLPVEVLKFLILFYCNSAGQFSLNMLKTERAL